MGLTPVLKLPYPELNDAANVPVDMRELCEAIELVLGGVLPQPVGRQFVTDQTVSSITSTTPTVLSPSATLTNPNTKLYLLVDIRSFLWVDALAGTATTGVCYVDMKITGATASYMTGVPRVENAYREALAGYVATIAPGAALTAQTVAWKLNTANGAVKVKSNRLTVMPVGWLKTGSIN